MVWTLSPADLQRIEEQAKEKIREGNEMLALLAVYRKWEWETTGRAESKKREEEYMRRLEATLYPFDKRAERMQPEDAREITTDDDGRVKIPGAQSE